MNGRRPKCVSTIAGAVETYMAVQMTAIKGLDQWIISLDERLFIPGRQPVRGIVWCAATASVTMPPQSNPPVCVLKVNLYRSSRLSSGPPQLRMYVSPFYRVANLTRDPPPTVWPPSRPSTRTTSANIDLVRADKQSYVVPNPRHETKAMVPDSSAVDSMATIVLAIRGTESFKDWVVNVKTEPKQPVGFLRDSSNACHAGFLRATKRIVSPVTERLRQAL